MFTTTALAEGTIVEVSPVIVMSKEEQQHLEKTELRNYIFDWGEDSERCCMAMGYIGIYNHSYQNNCEYFMDFDDDIMFIKTTKAIAAGEELTVNYNGDNEPGNEVIWFEVAD